MASLYPGSLDSFTTHSAGQTITSADINKIQDAALAIETTLGTNLANVSSETGVWLPTDYGLNCWSFDPMVADASSNVTNVGTPYYTAVRARAGNVTKIYFDCSNTGTANHYACLYSAAGNLLQQSAAVVPSVAGLTTFTITSTALTAGTKYLLMVYATSASGTIASFRRKNNLVANNVGNLGMSSPLLRAGTGSQTTLTTTAPSTTGTLTSNGIYHWCAVGP